MDALIEKIGGLSYIADPPSAAVIGDYDRDLVSKINQALRRSTGEGGSGMCVAVSCRYRMAQAKTLIVRVILQVSENIAMNRGPRGTQQDSGDVALQLLIDLSGWAPDHFSTLEAPERGDQMSLVTNTGELLVWEVVFETVTQLP